MKQVNILIPMKGHSERVPDKNLKAFNGRPLYHHVTSTVLASPYVSTVIINTDSERIKADVRSNFPQIQLVDRPEALCGDFVSMNKVLGYDLSVTEGEHYLQTHSTNPLLKTETINKAIEAYFNGLDQYDSLFAVTKWQTRFYWKDGSPVNHDPAKLIRTQDLPPMFEENSNFYLFSKTSFKNAGDKRIGLKPQLFEVNKLEAIDIDNKEDFLLAELVQRVLNKVKM